MRDLTGKATRAVVDIEFQEVPSYQVSSGNDIASEGNLGGESLKSAEEKLKQIRQQDQASENARTAGRTGATGATTPGGGGGGATIDPPPDSRQGTTGRQRF